MTSITLLLLCLEAALVSSFMPVDLSTTQRKLSYTHNNDAVVYLPWQQTQRITSSSSSSTALPMAIWFGGSSTADETINSSTDANGDSCELVAVRIERTSSNSRRIFGEITVPVPINDVWGILTDYDRLSIHVPNLVESKIVQKTSGGQPGDGQYRCRLFQKGAQKIIGFEFGASVTMNMREEVLNSANGGGEIRKIHFKCHDSFFFNEFDGEWKVTESINPATGEPESTLSYVVDVRPKGPVPVAALEWRIREDVPTNLRAVKKAASSMQRRVTSRNALPAAGQSPPQQPRKIQLRTVNSRNGAKASKTLARDTKMKVQWYEDETMAAYLRD